MTVIVPKTQRELEEQVCDGFRCSKAKIRQQARHHDVDDDASVSVDTFELLLASAQVGIGKEWKGRMPDQPNSPVSGRASGSVVNSLMRTLAQR